jgi:ribosomal protein L37E
VDDRCVCRRCGSVHHDDYWYDTRQTFVATGDYTGDWYDVQYYRCRRCGAEWTVQD